MVRAIAVGALALLVVGSFGTEAAVANEPSGIRGVESPDDDSDPPQHDPDATVSAGAVSTTPGGGSGTDGTDGADSVGDDGVAEPGSFVASTDAARSHPDIGPNPPPEPPCAAADYTPGGVGVNPADPNGPLITIDASCASPLTCGSERIDSFYTGEISGAPKGAYADYLSQVANAGTHNGGDPNNPISDADIDTVNTSIVDPLGDPPQPTSIATFTYCRHDNGAFETQDPTWGPTWAWNTSIEAEYPTTAVTNDLTQQVVATVGLYKPTIAAAPPIDTGHTFVKFPTWLWLENPRQHIEATSRSDLDLLEITVRASLLDVEFDMGDQQVTCTPDEMIPYNPEPPDEHHPIDDLTNCHLLFLELGDHEITATLSYEIEQRTRQRTYITHPWPDAPWNPHPGPSPYPQWPQPLTLTNDPIQYDVHQLLALNISEEQSHG